MLSVWNMIVGILSGVVKISLKILDMIRDKKLIDQGRAIERAENVKKDLERSKEELELNREQTEILLKEADKKDIISKMESGKF